ncbi:MAG: ketopantoate reductase family protein [Proteobacteria bacterium]|nr:ketopantoate reductase family protein [Pseudomonadota bacterium]
MRYIIYGAGGIGGTIGARLHLAGFDVVLIARGEHGEVLRRRGLEFITVDGRQILRIPVVETPAELDIDPNDAVILCMKTQHTQPALETLTQCLNPASQNAQHIVCAQNGVANETMTLRLFENVYGMLVNLPAMFLEPGQVITHSEGHGGVLDTGRFPHGVDDWCMDFTAALCRAGFSADPAPKIMRQKYAKLLTNLGNALQALLGDGVDIKELSRQLKKEAVACYEKAGIDCATADETHARFESIYKTGTIEGIPRSGGSSWQSMARGTGNIETDYLNGEIVLLGRTHGVATPANAAVQKMAHQMINEGKGLGAYSLDQILAEINKETT